MKKYTIFTAIIAVVIFSAMAFRPVTAITGKISPADGAVGVWAISKTDSAKATITSGAFSIPAKPGMYKIIIDAKEPRRDVILDNISVKDESVDLGEIVLQ